MITESYHINRITSFSSNALFYHSRAHVLATDGVTKSVLYCRSEFAISLFASWWKVVHRKQIQTRHRTAQLIAHQ